MENPGETAFGMRDPSGTLPPFGSRILSKFSHARPRLVFAIFPILILGAALRLMGIDHDLPFQYDPDEPIFVGGAIRMLYNRDMDPQWYGAPASTTMDLLAASYTAMYAAGRVSGEFRNPRDFRNYFHSHPTPFILAGRLISFIAGTALILFVFSLCSRTCGTRAALAAAFVTAVCPPLVALSRNARMDSLMTVLVVATFLTSIRVLEAGRWRDYLLAGTLVGLATMTKFPAVTASGAVCAAHFLRAAKQNIRLVAAGLASLGSAFLCGPYFFVHFPKALSDVRFEARSMHLSHTGRGWGPNLAWYLFDSLPAALTAVGILLALAGLAIAVKNRDRATLLWASYPFLFLSLIALLHLRWSRWELPALPFLAGLIGIAAIFPATVKAHRFRIAFGIVAVLAFGWTVANLTLRSVLDCREAANESTATIAGRWILNNVPPGSRIALERYCPDLPRGMYDVFCVGDDGRLQEMQQSEEFDTTCHPRGNLGGLKTLRDISDARIQYVVLSGFRDRFEAERTDYPGYVENYEKLVDGNVRLYEIRPVRGKWSGDRISVYALPDDQR